MYYTKKDKKDKKEELATADLVDTVGNNGSGEDMVGQDGYESDSPSEAPSLVSASSESGDEEAEEREAFIYTSELTLKDTGASLEFIPKKLITNVKDLENLDDFRDLENLPVDDTDDEMDEDMPPPLVDDYSDSESDTDTDEEVEAAAAEPPRKAKISYEDALKVAAKKNKEHWNTYYRGRQRRPLKRPPPQRLNRNRLVQFRGTVASAPCSILVDSGASRDFISQEKVEKLQLQTTAVDTPFGVSMADGRTVNSGRMVRGADIMIGPLALKRDLYVLNMTGLEIILGKPFLFDYNPNLDWMNNSMDLVQGGSMFSLNPNGDHHESKFGDARTTHAEMTEAVASGERCFATYVTLEVPQPEEDNHQQFTLELNNGSTCYVVVAPVLDVSDTGQLDASALEQLLTPTMSDTTQLSPESSTKIMNFIRKHPDVATESEAPSKPREVEGELVYHTITETPGSRPPFKQPYRMSSTEIKELKKMLDEMLAKGFIRPSSSAYGAPVMFVPKPDGTLRMVLDYRDLNSQTVKDRYPLPRDHDLFDQLQMNGARFLSSLDLLYGYWQVLIHPDDIHKTAIRTPLGSYEYVVMPMGLTNAPATFQRMMESVLRPFLTDFCMVYLDDIIVYSRTEEEHVEHIITILKALHEHGLKIKPKKCELFRTKIKFLGHIIDVSDGEVQLKPDPAKVETIATWIEPTNNTELQSFIGAVNYYSKMIVNYAEMAAPLMSIMAKKWNQESKAEYWTSAHSEAFEKLKKALMTEPVLTLPMPDKPFIVQTDASNIALGGVLMQETEDGRRVVVTYFSHKFTSSERNWPVHERELFGLVWALRKYRHYLMGAEVKYEGDHKPLTWIKTQRHLSQRQARWLETLESFDWTFKHVPGKDLVVPDAISRQPESTAVTFLAYLQNEAASELMAASREQPHLKETLAWIVSQLDLEDEWLFAREDKAELLTTYSKTDSCPTDPTNYHRAPAVPLNTTSLFHTTSSPFGREPDAASTTGATWGGSDEAEVTSASVTATPARDGENISWELMAVLAKVSGIDDTTDQQVMAPTQIEPTQPPLTVVAADNNTTALGDLLFSTSLMHRLQQSYRDDKLAEAIIAGEEKHGYVVRHGIVMRFDSDQSRFPCIYVPATASALQNDIISEFHDASMGGHLGAAKTYEKLRRNFYWINMKGDVEAFVKSCEACQRAKRRTTKPPGVNVPYAIPEMPFEVIAMDMKSGLPTTARGHNAFWVVVDKLTRRAHVIPCNTECKSADVARMVFDNVVRHWGVPHKIISDRDPRFIAAFWQELWKLIGTKLNMSTAEHPQTDGSSERFIGSISGMIRARAVKEHGKDWDLWISALEFAYNDSVNPSTGYTPFQLSIGRDPAMPITMLLSGILQRPSLYSQDDQFVDPQVFLNRFTTMLMDAKQQLRRQQQLQHQALLQKASYPVHYDPGDYVWMEASTLRSPLGTMAPRRHGPYRVMHKVGLNSYALDFGDKSKRHNPINEEKLSPYLDRDSRLPWPSHGVLPGSEAANARLPLPPPPPPGPDDGAPQPLTPSMLPVPLAPNLSPVVVPAAPTMTKGKKLTGIQQWREAEVDDVIKAQVKVKYANLPEPVWEDLHDVLKGGGFKKAKEFIQKQGGINHPHLWRTGFKSFNGRQYPFLTAEYQTRNTEQDDVHKPYYAVYADKDMENLTAQEVHEAEQARPTELGALHYVASKQRRDPRVLEVCCGNKSASKAIKRLWPNAKIVTLDVDPKYLPTILADVTAWNYMEDVFPRGYFDIIWASPPCTAYSIAKTTGVRDLTGADQIVIAVRRIIDYFSPLAWFIENPHALLHLRPMMQDIDHFRHTCTYCQYGTDYKKETDIWSNLTISLKHCHDTPCAHFQAYNRHARTAQSGPTHSGTPGTPREEAYTVPQPLMRVLMKAALQACGYMV